MICDITTVKTMLEVYMLMINGLLFALVSAILAIYLHKVRNADAEYVKARNVIEEIILSFDKEINDLKNKIEEIDAQLQNIQFPDIEKVFRQELNDLSAKIERVQEHLLELEMQLNKIRISSDKIDQRSDQGKEGFREEADLSLSVKPTFDLRRDKVLAPLTPTELKVLEILSRESDMTVREIRERIGLTREHTGRLMKSLYDKGYVERRTDKIPFRYRIKKEMESILSQ